MNILGMGPMEILLIVVLALIVFGPAKLPEIMGQVGKAIADFRRTTGELSDEFNRTIQAELQETRGIVNDTKSAVTGVHTSINAAIQGTPAPTLTTPAPAPTLAATNGTSVATNGVNGTSTGTNGTNGTASEPPLASTAQWSWETAAPAPIAPPVELATTAVEPSVSIDTTPPAASPPTPEQSSQRPATARKSTRRDDILPPY